MASIFVLFLGLLSLFEYIKSLYRNEAIVRRLEQMQARQMQNNNGEGNDNANQGEDNLEQELIEEAAAAEEQDGNQDEAMGFDELREWSMQNMLLPRTENLLTRFW